jgi:hypothetical protein
MEVTQRLTQLQMESAIFTLFNLVLLMALSGNIQIKSVG